MSSGSAIRHRVASDWGGRIGFVSGADNRAEIPGPLAGFIAIAVVGLSIIVRMYIAALFALAFVSTRGSFRRERILSLLRALAGDAKYAAQQGKERLRPFGLDAIYGAPACNRRALHFHANLGLGKQSLHENADLEPVTGSWELEYNSLVKNCLYGGIAPQYGESAGRKAIHLGNEQSGQRR